jgi:hypothetical protein
MNEEQLLADIDLDISFEDIIRKTDRPENAISRRGYTESELSEVQQLFSELAANHIRPVQDFMMDLRWGHATIAWIDICEPSVQSLRRAADKLEFASLSAALTDFSQALSSAKTSGSRTIDGTWREAVLARHETLTTLLPQTFAIDGARQKREAVILQCLMAQIPGVTKVVTDKIYAAGLTNLEAMLLTNATDLAAATGISRSLADRVVERFRTYGNQMKSVDPDPTRKRERHRVGELIVSLRDRQAAYDRAADAWGPDAETLRRKLRKERAQMLLEVYLLMARLGEVERLHELDRFPMEKKLLHMEAFLAEARQKFELAPSF